MSDRKIKTACVQLRCGDDVAQNVRDAAELIRAAHKDGAQFIATPENTGLMARDGGAKLEKTFAEKDAPALPQFCALAEELGIWLLVGSLAIKVSPGKTANRSYLIGPNGRVGARYDKIHLFDVNLPSGETYRESNTVEPGAEAVAVSLPWGRIGLSVCYDLRFPQLYRTLAKSRRRNPHRAVGFHRNHRQRRIGMCCCGRARSKMPALWWRRRRAAPMPMAARPMGIA